MRASQHGCFVPILISPASTAGRCMRKTLSSAGALLLIRIVFHSFRNVRFRPDFVSNSPAKRDRHTQSRIRANCPKVFAVTVGDVCALPWTNGLHWAARKSSDCLLCFIRCASISLSSHSFRTKALRPVVPTLIHCGSHSGVRRRASSIICLNELRTIMLPICRYSRTSHLTRLQPYPNVSMRQRRSSFTERRIVVRLRNS